MAMIIGHVFGEFTTVKTLIYTFHMPLFFWVAGYFFKPKGMKKQITVSVKSLLVPYAVGSALIIGRDIIYEFLGDDSAIKARIMAALLGLSAPSEALGIDSHIGPIWFLPCLFLPE